MKFQQQACSLHTKAKRTAFWSISGVPCAAHDGGRLSCPRLAVAEETGVEALRKGMEMGVKSGTIGAPKEIMRT